LSTTLSLQPLCQVLPNQQLQHLTHFQPVIDFHILKRHSINWNTSAASEDVFSMMVQSPKSRWILQVRDVYQDFSLEKRRWQSAFCILISYVSCEG